MKFKRLQSNAWVINSWTNGHITGPRTLTDLSLLARFSQLVIGGHLSTILAEIDLSI